MNTPLSRSRARTAPYRQFRRSKGGGNTPFHVKSGLWVPDPGPEPQFVYSHPNRLGVEKAPDRLLEQVRGIHPTLSVCRPPPSAPVPRNRWLVWAQEPHAQNMFCPGWYLVFVWEVTSTKAALPLEPFAHLEECIFAVMAQKVGGQQAYFAKMRDARAAAKAAREAQYHTDRRDRQADLLQARRIKNIGSGSKSPLHHDGTVVPSRGEANWAAETANSRIPGDVLRKKAEQREELRAAGWVP